MVSHPETGSDPPIRSDRGSGYDKKATRQQVCGKLRVLMFLTQVFTAIHVSPFNYMFKSLLCTLNDPYLVIFYGSVDTYY